MGIFVFSDADHGLWHKQCPFGCCQFIPVPIVDGRVQGVLYVVDNQFLVTGEWGTVSIFIGILVGLDVEQLHTTMRGSSDGQRDIDHLAVGIRCTCVC